MLRSVAIAVFMALPALAEFAQVNGVKLYYEVHGQGQPMVLLHGGMNQIETSFARQIPVFAKTHKVIAIEQMAHGHSPDVAGRALTYEQMSEDTAALLVKLGLGKVDLVGWSDGGQLALRLAFTHPELVRRVVASGVGFGATPEIAKELAAADFSNMFPAGRKAYERTSPDGAAHWKVYVDKAKAMWVKPSWGFSKADLGKIKLPVMVMAGDADVMGLDETVRIYRAIPKAKLYIVPGTGHETFQARPDWVNPVILDFLDRK